MGKGKGYCGKQSKKAISAKKACKRAIRDVCQDINCMIRDRMEVGCFNVTYTFRTNNGATEDIVKKVVSIYTDRGFEAKYDKGGVSPETSSYILELKWSNV